MCHVQHKRTCRNTIAALGNPIIKTPVLDRLVREGASFQRCDTLSPICVSARCATLTGLPPHKSGCVTTCPCRRIRATFLHHSHWVADRSLAFLHRRDRNRPSLLWSSFIKPHPPFENPMPWNKLYRAAEMPRPYRPQNDEQALTF